MCVLSIKVPIRRKSGNLFNDPRNLREVFNADNGRAMYTFNQSLFHRQDVTKGQFLSRVQLVGIQSFPSLSLVVKPVCPTTYPSLVGEGWKQMNTSLYKNISAT